MSIHVGELTTEVVQPSGSAGGVGPTGSAGGGTARQPRWSDLETQRRIAATLRRDVARTSTGSRHD